MIYLQYNLGNSSFILVMRRKNIFLVFSVAVFFIIAFLFLFFLSASQILISPLWGITSGAKQISEKKDNRLPQKLTVLFLGLDGRRGDRRPRCDAIHLVTVDFGKKKVRITSIPRGTRVPIPDVDDERAYIGNACHMMGIDYAVEQIERLSGIKHDYMVKAGFSQTIGIFRMIGLPTTQTLQFLRNRSLPNGDYQRSHNQAVFLKDMLISRLEFVASMPKTLQFVLYHMVDTDMDFETAHELFEAFLASNIAKEPKRIELVMRPFAREAKEMHFYPTTSEKDQDYVMYQSDLEFYLKKLLASVFSLIQRKEDKEAYAKIQRPFEQQLWLQLDDPYKRESIHLEFLKVLTALHKNDEEVRSHILDFLSEIEGSDQQALEQEAKKLLILTE